MLKYEGYVGPGTCILLYVIFEAWLCNTYFLCIIWCHNSASVSQVSSDLNSVELIICSHVGTDWLKLKPCLVLDELKAFVIIRSHFTYWQS